MASILVVMPNLSLLTDSEWVPAELPTRPGPAWWLVLLVPVILVGGAAGIVAGLPGGVVAAGVTAAALWGWVTLQGRLALRALGAVPLAAGEAPRLSNLVTGLAATMNTTPPGLWSIPEGGPNALICRASGPVIAVTHSLLQDFSRTELEAVAAHCLVRLAESSRAQQMAALGPLGVKFASPVGICEDGAAAALTRYPTALASAITKAQPRSDRFGAFWFVGDGPFHVPQEERAAAVADL